MSIEQDFPVREWLGTGVTSGLVQWLYNQAFSKHKLENQEELTSISRTP
jgi:hypothetical protein